MSMDWSKILLLVADVIRLVANAIQSGGDE